MVNISALTGVLFTLFILTATGTHGMGNTEPCKALGGACVDSRVAFCLAINHTACSSLGIGYAACCYNPHILGK
ncbi:hypothetical protein ACJMK2_008049 [Sinanodonta woodiana]|uniref:Uncharacterized protein n=1 Tax=Sinanodonta woodiana TaxID=1069815 RepID=A0ABD3VLY5_SINWO